MIFSIGAPPTIAFFAEVSAFSSFIMFFPSAVFVSIHLLFISGLYIFFFFTNSSHGTSELIGISDIQ
jgi:hypothetical protein